MVGNWTLRETGTCLSTSLLSVRRLRRHRAFRKNRNRSDSHRATAHCLRPAGTDISPLNLTRSNPFPFSIRGEFLLCLLRRVPRRFVQRSRVLELRIHSRTVFVPARLSMFRPWAHFAESNLDLMGRDPIVDRGRQCQYLPYGFDLIPSWPHVLCQFDSRPDSHLSPVSLRPPHWPRGDDETDHASGTVVLKFRESIVTTVSPGVRVSELGRVFPSTSVRCFL